VFLSWGGTGKTRKGKRGLGSRRRAAHWEQKRLRTPVETSKEKSRNPTGVGEKLL